MPEFSGRGPAREGPACSKADDQRKSESWPQFQGTWACNEAASEAGSLPPLLCWRLLLRASTKTDLGEAGRPKGYTEGPRGNAVVLIETDGPYMCPEPCRGQTAHPGHVHRVAERVAEWQCVDLGVMEDKAQAPACPILEKLTLF